MQRVSVDHEDGPLIVLQKGLYRARLAETAGDLRAAQQLRALSFLGNASAEESDNFDQTCDHMLIEQVETGALVCCFRFLSLNKGKDIEQSYSAQFYDLTALHEMPGPLVEMGRFCIRPGFADPDIVRLAWGAMTRFVDTHSVELLFGCASFPGTDSSAHTDAFAMLKARHLAPRQWQPRVKAADVFRFGDESLCEPDLRRAMAGMPPLLRTYLMLGGWVSDHAVIDERMNTLHVFIGVQISTIPPSRKRLLRAVAA